MRCYECGGTYQEKSGQLEMDDKDIPPYTVDNVEYLECDQCGDQLFSVETCLAIEKRRRELECHFQI